MGRRRTQWRVAYCELRCRGGWRAVRKSGSRIGVTLKDHTAAFHHTNHSLPKDEVVQIRKFLETCGITPTDFPL